MTTIRKIVTSKIDGNNADSSDTNEIRPFGETAFYIDDNDKLTLMMFEGARTHIKSKVLSPGVLYGSNADAGDGGNADTIKLIPDAALHYNNSVYNNHQHIVVDPTGPDHIHLRAGGAIDDSNADLYLGGELTFVRVSDTDDNIVISTTGVDTNIWTFDTNGTLTLPGTLALPGPMAIETSYGGAPTLVVDGKAHTVELRSNEYILIGYNNSIGNVYIGNQTSGQVDIVSNKFRVLSSAPTASTGAAGDQAGQVAFDDSYIYYCTQDYVSTSNNLTVLASSGSSVWVSSTDYPGDLVADFTANSTGWTYNGVTIVNISIDNQFGPGYLLDGVTSFGTVNGNDYTLVNPTALPNIWKRTAHGVGTW